MAITKILNIKESEGRNPASHLKNALEYIQNPDKTEECVLVGGINCLPDTAFEQMEETKNIFHKTGKRQGYHVIISFSPEEKVTAEQAMYVLEHFAKDVLGDDYEAVYAVHTDREHMHGHLIWNSVSMTTGKKYNSPKSNWKNHLQPITNKYCDELGLSIMPAEYSRNPKNISRDKWEKEMSMKEIILRDAKMCVYAAGNVEHFKYLMKRLGYVFKKDAWMEVQAPGFRYYHKLAKLDEMFSEDMLRHYVDMPWMAKPYFYSSDIRGLHRTKLSPYQKRFYAKLYRLRIVEQKRFAVGGAKYTEDLKRFHQLQDEYLLIVNNDIKSVVELVDFISGQKEKMQQIEGRQKAIYRENSSRKRSIKTEAQYREYQIWHVEVQEELDELKQEKKEIKRQIQLADDIIKEDLYTAYYAVSGKEEIVADRDVEIPGMEENTEVEKVAAAVVKPDVNVEVMNPGNNQNEIGRQREQVDSARKQETDVKGKSEFVEPKEKEPMVKVGWIVRRISELGGYENVSDSVKADIFGFDIADVSESIRLFSDVMKRLDIKLAGDELYEEFQRIYDKSVGRDDGRITDSQGRTVDFKNTILIMTSNIGANYLLEGIREDGTIEESNQNLVMNDLRAHFRPEFLNRLDEIIMFKPLTKSNIHAIIDLLVKDVNKRLVDKELSIELTDAAKNFVVEGGYDPMYGARPLKRYLQKNVETLAAKLILAGDVGRGDRIEIDVVDGKLEAKVKGQIVA